MALITTTLIPETAADVSGTGAIPCDLIEVRLDGLPEDEIEAAVHAAERPVVAACRREEDGGVRPLSETERAERLRHAIEAGADLVDIEHDAAFREELTRLALTSNAHVIVSHHDLEQAPDLHVGLRLLEEMNHRADILKLATATQGPEDVEALFELALQAPTLGTPFTIMAVGDSALRAAAGPLGMALVYTAPGRASVPGQLPARLQNHLPRSPPPPEGFRDYVLLGHPVGHSLSPAMQNAAFAHLGHPGRYRLVDLAPEDVEAGFRGLKALGVAGGNVTSPHKGAIHDLCDELRPRAREARAVNSFKVTDDGRVLGDNTDGLGVVHALDARGEALPGRRVVVVGAGGTARAASHALTQAGAEICVCNRTAKKVEALAQDLGVEQVPFDEDALAKALPEDAILFNATPVDLPIEDDVLSRIVVFDATYGPEAARLARRAELAGTRALDGLDLLVHQGDLALRFWLDLAADERLLGVMSTAARTGALEQRYRRRGP